MALIVVARIADVFNPPLRLASPETERDDDRVVPDVTVSDEPTPRFPEMLAEDPTPKKPLGKTESKGRLAAESPIRLCDESLQK